MTRTLSLLLLILAFFSHAAAAEIEAAKDPIRPGAERMLKAFSESRLPGAGELKKEGQAQIFVEIGGAYRKLYVFAKAKLEAQAFAENLGASIEQAGMHPEKVLYDFDDGILAVTASDSDEKLWQTERTNSIDFRPLEEKLRTLGLQPMSVMTYRKHVKYSGPSFPKDESRNHHWRLVTGAKEPISVTVKAPPYSAPLIFLAVVFPGFCGVLGIVLAVVVGRMQSIDIKRRRKLYPKILYGIVFGSMIVHAPMFLYLMTSGIMRPALDLWTGSPLSGGLTPLLVVPIVVLFAVLPIATRMEKKLFGPDESTPVVPRMTDEEASAAKKISSITTACLAIGLAMMFLPKIIGAPESVRLIAAILGLVIMLSGTYIAPKWVSRSSGVPVTPTDDPDLKAMADELATRMGTKVKRVQVTRDLAGRSSINAMASLDGSIKVSLLAKDTLEPEEMRAILSHEIAHLKLKHARKRLLLLAAPYLALMAMPLLLILNREFLIRFSNLRILLMGIALLSFPCLFFIASRLAKKQEFEPTI